MTSRAADLVAELGAGMQNLWADGGMNSLGRQLVAGALNHRTLIHYFVGWIRVRFDRHGFYEPDEEGDAAYTMAVYDEFDHLIVDALAWPSHQPAKFARRFGTAGVLGEKTLHDSAAAEKPVRLVHTPLAFLQRGGDGMVILDDAAAYWVLSRIETSIETTDPGIAERVDKIINPPKPKHQPKIMIVPR